MISPNKLGYVLISSEFITHMQDSMFLLLSRFIPMHIEILEQNPMTLRYSGVCEEFDELNSEDLVPQYGTTFTMNGERSLSLEFNKI